MTNMALLRPFILERLQYDMVAFPKPATRQRGCTRRRPFKATDTVPNPVNKAREKEMEEEKEKQTKS